MVKTSDIHGDKIMDIITTFKVKEPTGHFHKCFLTLKGKT